MSNSHSSLVISSLLHFRLPHYVLILSSMEKSCSLSKRFQCDNRLFQSADVVVTRELSVSPHSD